MKPIRNHRDQGSQISKINDSNSVNDSDNDTDSNDDEKLRAMGVLKLIRWN
jgi:hypothetical protein